jgi:hypothetical protein
MEFVRHLYHKVSRIAVHMDFSDCAILVACVLVVGLVCLRGFGSRTNY